MAVNPVTRGHHRIVGLAWLAIVLLIGSGCTPDSTAKEPTGTDYVVFIDFSRSVQGEGRDLFRQDLINRVIPTLDAGDRILIAPISDQTFTKFRPLVEATLPVRPKFNGWSDNVLRHKGLVKEVDEQIPLIKDRLGEEVEGVFVKDFSSTKTDILSSLTIAEKLFHNVMRRKVLILMSDMIEDYPPYRFDKVSWNEDTAQNLLNELEAIGAIPNLSGVCIYVSGASAKSPGLAKEIGSFWQAYFERTRADTHPSRYAHVLLHWPPSTSCDWQA